jgi:hypothetical protein
MQSVVIKGDAMVGVQSIGATWSRVARRLARSVRYGAVCSAALLLVACGGDDNGSPPASGASPGSGSSSGGGGSSGGGSSSSTTPLTAAQITQAAASAQSYYLTLPHISLASDLTTLAAYMVSSGKFSAAAVSPGGISATLPDGSNTYCSPIGWKISAAFHPRPSQPRSCSSATLARRGQPSIMTSARRTAMRSLSWSTNPAILPSLRPPSRRSLKPLPTADSPRRTTASMPST